MGISSSASKDFQDGVARSTPGFEPLTAGRTLVDSLGKSHQPTSERGGVPTLMGPTLEPVRLRTLRSFHARPHGAVEE